MKSHGGLWNEITSPDNLLAAEERGQYADLQWFYHYMERSDAMIFAILQRRRAAKIRLALPPSVP